MFLDITTKLEAALDEFGEHYLPDSFDPFAALEWPKDPKEEDKLWAPLSKLLASGPRNASEIDQIKRSRFEENKANNQTLVVQKFDRIERRLIRLHRSLVEALRNSDNLDGGLKTKGVLASLNGYFRIYQIGLICSPALAEQAYFYWYGILFFLGNKSAWDTVEDKDVKIAHIMHGVRRAVIRKAAEEIGSKKLGEVFKLLAKDGHLAEFMALTNFSCMTRGKPNEWQNSSKELVAKADRKTQFLRYMLDITFEQFYDEVNTGVERDNLKRLIVTIRAKRDLNKDRPGEKDIAKIMGLLEKRDFFDPPKSKSNLDNTD